jgi:hypothetical protein
MHPPIAGIFSWREYKISDDQMRDLTKVKKICNATAALIWILFPDYSLQFINISLNSKSSLPLV